jgi:hypothetical protein
MSLWVLPNLVVQTLSHRMNLKKNLSLNLGFFFTLYLSLKTQLVFASSAGAVPMWIQHLCRNFETFFVWGALVDE